MPWPSGESSLFLEWRGDFWVNLQVSFLVFFLTHPYADYKTEKWVMLIWSNAQTEWMIHDDEDKEKK